MPFTESDLRTVSQQLHEPEWLLQERLHAWQALQKILNDPHLKQKPQLPESLAPPQIKIKKQKGVRVARLHDLLKGKGADGAKTLFLGSRAREEKSWQLDLLKAFFSECTIFIAEDSESELELESQGGPAMNWVVLGRGVQLEYTHRVKDGGFQSYEIHAAENAQLARLLIQPGEAGFLSSIFVLNERAKMEHVSVVTGGGTLDMRTRLEGKHAEAHDTVLFSENDAHRLTLYSLLHQIAPDTNGDISIRGIAQDTAHARLEGMIRIGKEASNSDSFLDQHVLLLNAGARADTNPQLEIENNDVRSSHSASVGQIQKDKMFYLMTRGIPREGARQLLVGGFLESAISKIRHAKYQERTREVIASAAAF